VISRVRAIEIILDQVEEPDVVLSTTGMVSREVFATRDRTGNFYMIGSMGLLSAVGLGISLLAPDRRVYVLDGDGSALMSLGTLPLIAVEAGANLTHIVLDNESYESTGAQPSIAKDVSLGAIALASGYESATSVSDESSLQDSLKRLGGGPRPDFVLAKVGIAPVEGIPRVSFTPEEIRDRFAAHIRQWSL
jgi:phosphonopyruvate decarboxylase